MEEYRIPKAAVVGSSPTGKANGVIMKRYGPYFHTGTGYTYYMDVDNLGNKKHVLQHRDVMEKHLGRKLEEREVVHHRNHIKTDNAISNLEVMKDGEHAKVHAKPVTLLSFTCPQCSVAFTRRKGLDPVAQSNLRAFCSKSCSATFYANKRFIGIPHGTKNAYSYHRCRCALCKEANSSYQRKYRNSG